MSLLPALLLVVACVEPADLTVVVTAEDGAEVTGAEVRLYRSEDDALAESGAIASEVLDASGEVTFLDLSDGSAYFVDVQLGALVNWEDAVETAPLVAGGDNRLETVIADTDSGLFSRAGGQSWEIGAIRTASDTTAPQSYTSCRLDGSFTMFKGFGVGDLIAEPAKECTSWSYDGIDRWRSRDGNQFALSSTDQSQSVSWIVEFVGEGVVEVREADGSAQYILTLVKR